MKIKYKIVDNFLDQNKFKKLKEFLMGNYIPWYYQTVVSSPKINKGYYLTHMFFNDTEGAAFSLPYLKDVLDILKPEVLLRAKANFYPSGKDILEHGKHADFTFKHKGFILSINTNDGFTRLKDGTKIQSIENRGLFFDASIEHNSSNCTNTSSRININFNYF
jgi:hypothetical protein